MINSEDFAKRLDKVIDFYGETASSFAEKIGVQRSSISHILSGRNKPSLDFVLKILSVYPEVELYWILNGKGEFPSVPKTQTIQPASTSQISESILPKEITSSKTDVKSIERIVIFYTDGTFKSFEN
jgi:transcriptional regulator with XRE-family HTH domain|uniref:helix-turn-helix domain-containing protein n=1 Tax=Gelidibacter sp. TaxID=2018083 RepID=UPI00404926AB